MLVKMRTNTPIHSTSLRRSPRFLRPDQVLPTAIGKSRTLSPKTKRVCECWSESKPSRKPSDGFENLGDLKSLGTGGVSNRRRSLRISEQGKGKGLRERAANESGDSGDGERNGGNLSTGLMESSRLGNGIAGFRNPRRSPRILSQKKAGKGDSPKREIRLKKGKAENCLLSKKGERGKSKNVSVRSEAIVECATEQEAEEELECDRSGAVEVVCRKRKLVLCEESSGTVHGWTEEQKLALERAYLSTKPTPRFWKKVSRLVPGKSAQDCFDKLNSDYATPPQRERVSRAKRKHASPLSASKILKPTESKFRKPSRKRQKTRASHKNARNLLQDHYQQSQVHEADLFSILEPNLDISGQHHQQSIVLSTPKQLKGKQEFDQKFNELSSSIHKKPLSRFSASRDKVLISPPVLKLVKNKNLHEKYIDQLHSRDAQRKTASDQTTKCSMKMDNRSTKHNQKLNVVLAAKNALVSDATDAITMLQQEQSNATSISSDLEYDIFKGDDDSEVEM